MQDSGLDLLLALGSSESEVNRVKARDAVLLGYWYSRECNVRIHSNTCETVEAQIRTTRANTPARPPTCDHPSWARFLCERKKRTIYRSLSAEQNTSERCILQFASSSPDEFASDTVSRRRVQTFDSASQSMEPDIEREPIFPVQRDAFVAQRIELLKTLVQCVQPCISNNLLFPFSQ